MIDTVIFDLGRVLVDFYDCEIVQEFGFEQEVYEKIVGSFYDEKKRLEYDRSSMSDMELIEMFTKDIPECRAEFEKVFHNEGKAVVERDYTRQWIMDLKKKGLKVYLLSNYARNTYNLSKEKLDFLEMMDGRIFSWEVKKVKPEKEIYQSLIDKYNLVPENCVFIDDKQINLDAAKQLGIKTILFENKEDADKKLMELGI